MAQPPSYNRKKNFADDFANETDHPSLNAELDRASNSINDIRFNLAILQADDGKLRPSVVTADSISEELRISLVEGVVMDAQTMLDKSLTAADSSSTSAKQAKAYEELARASSAIAVNSAKALSLAVSSDWNATEGAAVILNKPKTLAGYGITDALSKSALKTRDISTNYRAGDIVVAPYILDSILVCMTTGTTSGNELEEDRIIPGSDVTDGSVVWNVRTKFSSGLKTIDGKVFLDSHAALTDEYGAGNEQYFGHVKVVDDCFSNKSAADSIALSPAGAIAAINRVMLGQDAGVITQSMTWKCEITGTYDFILIGGGGGGGGGGPYVSYDSWGGSRDDGDYWNRTDYGGGGGGGGGGSGGITTLSLSLSEGEECQINIGAGGAGGTLNGGKGGDGGITTLTKLGQSDVVYTSPAGKGGSAGGSGGAWRLGASGGGGGSGGLSAGANSTQATNGGTGGTSFDVLPVGGAGGNGAFIGVSTIYSRFGNGGGGGRGNGGSGIDGSANELAMKGQNGTGGNGAQGMVYITLSAI